MFFDAHIHLQDCSLMPTANIIKDCLAKNIKKVICISEKPHDWQKVAQLALDYPDFVIPAFGLHPWLADTKQDWQDLLQDYLQRFPQAIVGECGIDTIKDVDIDIQLQAFKFQIELAKKLSRPLVIHSVKAQSHFEKIWQTLPSKFMIHSFSGNLEQLKIINKYDGYVSLNQTIFKNKQIEEIIANIPADRLLIESDAPYQSLQKPEPTPHDEIIRTISKIALLCNKDFDSFSQQIYNNTMEFIKC